MSLIEERPEGILTIRAVQADRIIIEQRELSASFIVAPEQLLDSWAPTAVEQIDQTAIEPIIALAPQVVLIGTGARQRFVAPRVQALLLQRGIGVESMDNAAAARTYNLLAQEGRRVVAAFLLPGG